MNEIKLKTWIIWGVILFSVGLLADYFFWHLVLGERNQLAQMLNENNKDQNLPGGSAFADSEDTPIITDAAAETAISEDPAKNNFLVSLQKCAPEVAAQAIATPEALMEYLKKSVGVEREDIGIENYHLTLKDGSLRRIHVVASDDTNGTETKEVKYFKLDEEGYPERVPTEPGATIESLIAQGTVERHEVRSELLLKDGSAVTMEIHDNKVYEFQFNNHGKVLSCRFSSCHCP